MIPIKNNRGFALITSLMFTVITLVITMTLLYMVTSGIKASGTMKIYRSATEAAYGGVDIVIKDLLNNNIANAINLSESLFTTTMTNYVTGLNGADVKADCLQAKLTMKPLPAKCSTLTKADKNNYDISFKLGAEIGSAYNVYANIVDTMVYTTKDYVNGVEVTVTSTGNTDLSPVILEGASVTETGGGGNKNPSQPFRYRLEVQAERPAPANEKSKISVMYIY